MKTALDLSRAELACALETLAAAGDAGHDAHGKPLNGLLRSGIAKLRRIWQLRYDAAAPGEEALTTAEVRAAFAEGGEVFPADLSAVAVTLTKDVHYDNDVTLSVAVYGKEGMDGAPLWEREHRGKAHLLAADSVEEAGWVGASLVRSLFSPDLGRALAERGVSISVNPGWPSAVEVHPLDDGQDVRVMPEIG